MLAYKHLELSLNKEVLKTRVRTFGELCFGFQISPGSSTLVTNHHQSVRNQS